MATAKKPEKMSFVFESKEFECVPAMVRNYKVQKAIANAESNPMGYYNGLAAIFDGKDEEYAEALGGDMAKLSELYVAAVQAVGAKN